MKWAVVDQLHDYLYGTRFEVRTDNNPLIYMLTSANLNATGHCWLAALSTYDFSLKYRSGIQNIDADTLSRRPHHTPTQEPKWKDISAAGVRAMCWMSVVTKQRNTCPGRAVDQLGASMYAIPQAYCNLSTLRDNVLSSTELSNAQQEDSAISEVWSDLYHGDATS